MFYKRGQAWGFDLLIATIIFLAGILLFYTYTINLSNETQDIISEMSYEGNIIAENILSEGSPLGWNATNVNRIGLLTLNKINDSKLEQLYLLSVKDYQKSKSIFTVNNDYYIFFQEPIVINATTTVEGIGKQPNNPKNLIKTTRITIYKDKPTTLNIDIWN